MARRSTQSIAVLFFALAAAMTTIVAGLVVGLDLPRWVVLAFALSFPVDYLALRAFARWELARWQARLERAVAAGDIPANPIASLPSGTIVRWYYPEALFPSRVAALLLAKQCFKAAAEHYEEAYRRATDEERPGIARSIWAARRRLRGDERQVPGWDAYLTEALVAPDPPSDLLQDYAECLLARGDVDAAKKALESALPRAESHGQTFKVLCKLAAVEARGGRFGAADGYLHEAEARMPSGDPGFRSLYARTIEEVSALKRSRREEGLDLVQLARGRSGS